MGDPMINVLGPLDGAEIPGGCDRCDAYQRVRIVGGGVYEVDVLHDDGCPRLAGSESGESVR